MKRFELTIKWDRLRDDNFPSKQLEVLGCNVESRREDILESAALGYPLMMINKHNDTVVMFTAHGEGMVIACSSGNYPAGHCSKGWAMGRFSPFTGSVTIQTVNGK